MTIDLTVEASEERGGLCPPLVWGDDGGERRGWLERRHGRVTQGLQEDMAPWWARFRWWVAR